MVSEFVSLAAIVTIALVCPLIVQAIPRKPIPETVLLLIAGAVFGPHMLGVIEIGDSITMLSELGLGFLFMLAGYEIDPKMLTDSEGKHGLFTWIATFAIAMGVMMLLPTGYIAEPGGFMTSVIVLTTTALGTLMPILAERNLSGTRVGDLVIKYGTWGELGPVLAMAILLSARAKWQTALILVALGIVCVVIARSALAQRRNGTALYRFLEQKAETNAQTFVRSTVFIMVLLVTLSAIFHLDIVLGAFAAGFVLRYVIPEGNARLEGKLNAIAYGFLVPLFFVVSGCKIDLAAVGENPVLLVVFIVLLLLVRAAPIVVSLSANKTIRNDVSFRNRLSVAFYCTTALPLIVAVTSIAVTGGAMSQDTASVLVAAGAVSVFIMPLGAAITYRVVDIHPVDALREAQQTGKSALQVFQEHIEKERAVAQKRKERAAEYAFENIKKLHDETHTYFELFANLDLTELSPEKRREIEQISAEKRLHALEDLERRKAFLSKSYDRTVALAKRIESTERYSLEEMQDVARHVLSKHNES